MSLSALTLAVLTACGGGGGGGDSSAVPPVKPLTVDVPVMVSDAASDDWATIGVKVLGLSLTKQDGTQVQVTLPSTPLPLNLAQLDQLGEVLSTLTLNAGDVYTGATLTVSANPGDVSLTVSADPEAGFPEAAGTSIPSSRIQIQHTSGTSPNMTVSIPVTFASPLTVPSTPGTAINLEVDLNHPAFLTSHVPVGSSSAIWAVNFNGPVHHKPCKDFRAIVLRHSYGQVTGISSDNSTLSFTKELPTAPVVSPETAVSTGQAVSVLADAANGTLFYNVDAKTTSTIKDFSSVASALAAGNHVRVAARYQQNGTLVATRIWVSSSFANVWVSPEGHVLHVNSAGSAIWVADENGKPVKLAINAQTQFFFRQPANGLADATPIGTGPTFINANNFSRGFKVHTQVVDPTASTPVAQTVDIETAAFGGKISSVTNSGFVMSGRFNTSSDNYDQSMAFVSASTANGTDPVTGAALTGFKFWNYSFPTVVDSGSNAVADYVSATGGSVDFGNGYTYYAQGTTAAVWGDPAQTNGWAAPWVILEPTNLPLATVATAPTPSANSFGISVSGGSKTVIVNYSVTAGSVTQVFQVDRSGGTVTVSPVDLTTSAGQSALVAGLAAGNRVKVSAVPQPGGSLKAYTINFYTGTQPH